MTKLFVAYGISLSVVTGLWASLICYTAVKGVLWFISDLSRIANR